MARIDLMAFIDAEPVAAPDTPGARDQKRVVAVLALALAPLGLRAAYAPAWPNAAVFVVLAISFALALVAIATGIQNRAVYEKAMSAEAPRFPLIAMGSAWLGVSAGALTYVEYQDIFAAWAAVPLSILLALAAFGMDPLRGKGPEAADAKSLQKADQLIKSADMQMEVMTARLAAVPDADVQVALTETRLAVMQLQDVVRADPRRVHVHQAKLRDHLDRVVEATRRFAAAYPATRNEAAKTAYTSMLSVLVDICDPRRGYPSSAAENRLDLEIGRLMERLTQDRAAA